MPDSFVVLMTSPDEETSLMLAKLLVESSLAACVNIVPKLRSVYQWEGKLCDDSEQLLLAKTTEKRLPELISKVKQAHPFEVPEIVALKIAAGNMDYLDWIADICK